jgi:hypothetical protein
MQTHILKNTLAAFCCTLLLSTGFVQAQTIHNNLNQSMAINANRYRIDVTIPTPLMNKLITQWNARNQQDIANKIRVELWKVSYIPSPKAPNTIEILLQQKMNSDVAVIQSGDGVGYTMPAAPAGNNYVALVYCELPANVTDLAIKGRPYYAAPNSSGLQVKQYVSNVKAIFNDPNIRFGIYSLTGPGSLSQLDFSFSSASADPQGAKTMDFDLGGFVGDVVNDIGDAANAVIDAATWVAGLPNDLLNVFNQLMQMLPQNDETKFAEFLVNNASAVTKIIQAAPKAVVDGVQAAFGELGNGFFAIVLDGMNLILYANTPHIRNVSQYEYDWANAYMYNGNLPPIGRLRITNLMSVDHRACTLPMPDGTIHLNLGDAFADPIDFSKPYYTAAGQLFIHEMGHAWQIGKYGVVPSVINGLGNTLQGLIGNNPYAYASDCNDTWIHYNIEQQASIIDGGYAILYNRGYAIPGDKGSCGTEVNDIIQDVRAGIPLDKSTIDQIFYNFAHDPNVMNLTGGPNGILVKSPGTKQNGDGYYMLGHNANTFFYYSNQLKLATVNWGPIRDKYAAATQSYSNGAFGAEFGYLGWPTGNMTALKAGGWFQSFQHGSIYWTPQFGAFVVDGKTLDAWAATKWEQGPLGYPISDFIPDNPGGVSNLKYSSTTIGSGYQKFQGGIIKLGAAAIPGQVVLNNQLIQNRDRSEVGATRTPGASSPTQPGNSTKPSPGSAQSLNPQPLPPKINRTGVNGGQ